MSQVVNVFKKQGGLKLLKSYWGNGVFFYAVLQFLLTGKTTKALEYLRLGVALKMHKRFKKEFLPVLMNFDDNYKSQESYEENASSKKVWIYWSTGLEETAPPIVKLCYSKVQEYLKDREIILLSKFNYQEYVDLPDYIVDKYNKGLIEHVHFADLLRIELLAKHGGTWMDSTVFLMSDDIPPYMLDSDLFMFQKLKPGVDGNVIKLSSWFITSKPGNKLILAQRHLMREYWKRYNKAKDYFFFHHFMSMVADYYADDWKKVIQVPNSAPHLLLLMLFDPFSQEKWDAASRICPVQKLSYKFGEKDSENKGTFYDYITK